MEGRCHYLCKLYTPVHPEILTEEVFSPCLRQTDLGYCAVSLSIHVNHQTKKGKPPNRTRTLATSEIRRTCERVQYLSLILGISAQSDCLHDPIRHWNRTTGCFKNMSLLLCKTLCIFMKSLCVIIMMYHIFIVIYSYLNASLREWVALLHFTMSGVFFSLFWHFNLSQSVLCPVFTMVYYQSFCAVQICVLLIYYINIFFSFYFIFSFSM